MDYLWFALLPTIIFAVIAFCFILFLIYFLHKRKKKNKEFIDEMMRRLPGVDYTEIIASSYCNNGTISTFNSNGEVGYGSYNSRPTTKFLVVYKSGDKQIVNLLDGTPLFNEYVQLLKK
ncbi:MAG: hypothetical protein K2L42_02650 [Clostridia bacterium]|nr:hypothetical protein [Clostridia bacterium]